MIVAVLMADYNQKLHYFLFTFLIKFFTHQVEPFSEAHLMCKSGLCIK